LRQPRNLPKNQTKPYSMKHVTLLTFSRRKSHPDLFMRVLVILMLFASVANAQDVIVKGKISDETGSVMPGVNVVVKGTTSGTTSDENGDFAISVPGGDAVLSFSFIGYASQDVAVNGRTFIEVKLEPDIRSLSEVVVIGYGTQRQEAVTGSVVSMQAKHISEVPSPNITQALQGRMAGVEMSQSSSKPGAPMQIRIRGTRSLLASNDPLIVIDGIPFGGSIADINPNDVKSIDVLKDASSTAIYGSRGANGVILITTNRGAFGQKPQVSYNTYYGVKKIFGEYPMMEGEEFVNLRTTAGVYTSNGLDESNDVNTDWQGMFWRTAAVTSHDINLTGGTTGGSYNFGLGYYKDEAVIPGQDFKRFSLRGSIDQRIGNRIRVGFSTNTNYSVNNGNNMGFYDVLSASPIANPFNDDGTIKRTIRMPLDEQWTKTESTVDALGDNWIDQTRTIASYNAFFAEVEVPGIKGLSYRLNLGLNYRQANNGQFTGEGVFSTNPTTVSSASTSSTIHYSWTIENLLTYDRTIAGKHNVNFVALYSAQQDTDTRSSVSVKDIPASAFQFYNLGRANQTPIIDPLTQTYGLSGLMSAMGRLQYSYDDRYMLSVSYRFDGSSRLAPGHQWVSYPAISAGWNMHTLPILSEVNAINRLKFRVGYGTTSNQAIAPYQTLGLLQTRPYNFGSTFTTGYYVSALPNPELGWEYTSSTNYALEFGLLGERLTGTLEYYQAKTEDLLFVVPLQPTSGVNSYTANIGSSENKGYEITLNGVILDNPDGFRWEVGFNLYANRNRLTSLNSGTEKDEGNWWFVGQPIDVIYDFEYQGLWQEGDPYRDILEPGGNVGMIKVKYTGEYNDDGTPKRAIGAADRQIHNMQPNFQGGFNTRLSYKGFDFSMVGVYKNGGLVIATPYGANGYLNILSGRRGNIDVDYWTPENTDARYPKPGGIGGDQPKYLNTLSYFDASFLKIRTISLGYNFDQANWFHVKGISKFRVYATVQNPFVMFSPYYDESGMDPETNSYANENAAVNYDNRLRRLLTIGTNTPSTRNYIIGLNLTF
jgi:TonB-linked SusC/RagA family outer membrane protein